MISKLDYDLLLQYREPKPWPTAAEDQGRFRALSTRKLVDPVRYRPDAGGLTATHYKITPKGEDALLEFEQAQKSAKQARARFWITTAIAAAGAVGALIKYIFG